MGIKFCALSAHEDEIFWFEVLQEKLYARFGDEDQSVAHACFPPVYAFLNHGLI